MTLNSFKTKLIFVLFLGLFLFMSCQNNDLKIITVTGEISASKMGVTLPHEHVLVDFAPIDSLGVNKYNNDSVIAKVLPYFEELKPYKVKTFVDCTPEFLGRNPQLLAELSRRTGINILTNTGWYAADNERHLPKEIKDLSAEQIAAIWIEEAKNGIGNTGIKPGFIKIGINNNILSEIDKKLITAAALTHLETGLTIVSHTTNADPVLEQVQILQKYNIDPSALIWAHAMMEPSFKKILTLAGMGVWTSFDGVKEDLTARLRISNLVEYMKAARHLNRILLSHDAGWYDPGKPNGGKFTPYTELFSSFSLVLLSAGITREELNLMTITNPAEAFSVRVRKIGKN